MSIKLDITGTSVPRDPVLRVEYVSKSYGRTVVVKDISVAIESGEVVGFVGPNGAGKSTTMKIIAGLVKPDSGHVTISGLTLKRDPRRYREQLGVLLESPGYYPGLTAGEHLAFLLRLRNCYQAAVVKSTLERVGLGQHAKTQVGRFSTGMKQRLSIAMAILHAPRLLILDEPTSGLDPAAVTEVRSLIMQLARQHETAVLISTHVLPEIEHICSRVLFIKAGMLVTPRPFVPSDATPLLVSFLTSNVVKAADIITQLSPTSTTSQRDDRVECELNTYQIAAVVAELVRQSVDVYAVEQKQNRLERVYLETLGGNPNVE